MALSAVSAALLLALAAAVPQAELPAESPTKVEVLEYQVKSLKSENAALQGDKQALLRTIRGIMWNNQTVVMQHQLSEMSHRTDIVEERSAQERSQLQAEAQEADRKATAAAATAQDAVHGAEVATSSAREAIRKVEAEKAALAKLLHTTQSLFEEEKRKDETLTRDKQSVMRAMNGVLRQNEEYARRVAAEQAEKSSGQQKTQKKDLHAAAEESAAEKSRRQQRKKDEATAEKKLGIALRGFDKMGVLLNSGGAANDTASGARGGVHSRGRRLRHAASMKEDPVASMGDTSALTTYIANYKAKAWAAKEAGSGWAAPAGEFGPAAPGSLGGSE